MHTTFTWRQPDKNSGQALTQHPTLTVFVYRRAQHPEGYTETPAAMHDIVDDSELAEVLASLRADESPMSNDRPLEVGGCQQCGMSLDAGEGGESSWTIISVIGRVDHGADGWWVHQTGEFCCVDCLAKKLARYPQISDYARTLPKSFRV